MTPLDEPLIERRQTLVELAREPTRTAGVRIHVEEDGLAYHSLGLPPSSVCRALNWRGGSVWMPEHVVQMIRWKHGRITSPVRAAAYVLSHPRLVSTSTLQPDVARFVVDAADLRDRDLLASASVRLVDLLVELRDVGGVILRRAFHLAPTRQYHKGAQRWPSSPDSHNTIDS
jgi:hypothetical protein